MGGGKSEEGAVGGVWSGPTANKQTEERNRDRDTTGSQKKRATPSLYLYLVLYLYLQLHRSLLCLHFDIYRYAEIYKAQSTCSRVHNECEDVPALLS